MEDVTSWFEVDSSWAFLAGSTISAVIGAWWSSAVSAEEIVSGRTSPILLSKGWELDRVSSAELRAFVYIGVVWVQAQSGVASIGGWIELASEITLVASAPIIAVAYPLLAEVWLSRESALNS